MSVLHRTRKSPKTPADPADKAAADPTTAPIPTPLLIAGVGVGIVAMVVDTARVTQLRRLVRDRRQRH
jgi:hypothetical protein